MDDANNRMLITTAKGVMHSINLTDTSLNPDLPAGPSGGSWSRLILQLMETCSHLVNRAYSRSIPLVAVGH